MRLDFLSQVFLGAALLINLSCRIVDSDLDDAAEVRSEKDDGEITQNDKKGGGMIDPDEVFAFLRSCDEMQQFPNQYSKKGFYYFYCSGEAAPSFMKYLPDQLSCDARFLDDKERDFSPGSILVFDAATTRVTPENGQSFLCP